MPRPLPSRQETSLSRSTTHEKVTARIGALARASRSCVCFLTGLLSHLIQHPPAWFWLAVRAR